MRLNASLTATRWDVWGSDPQIVTNGLGSFFFFSFSVSLRRNYNGGYRDWRFIPGSRSLTKTVSSLPTKKWKYKHLLQLNSICWGDTIKGSRSADHVIVLGFNWVLILIKGCHIFKITQIRNWANEHFVIMARFCKLDSCIFKGQNCILHFSSQIFSTSQSKTAG